MIVDTMTFEEITEYLLKTVFSKKNVNEIIQRRIEPKMNQYRRECIKWNQKQNHSLYKIFDPIIIRKENEEDLVMVPLCSKRKSLDYQIFTTFRYKTHRYVALHLIDGFVWFFSWHSLRRYAERFLKDKDSLIDVDFIADMLVYNGSYHKTDYTYKGKQTKMFVTIDGAFLSETYKNCILSKTFISEKEYFENQKELDVTAFEDLQKYIKEDYGYWLMRG